MSKHYPKTWTEAKHGVAACFLHMKAKGKARYLTLSNAEAKRRLAP